MPDSPPNGNRPNAVLRLKRPNDPIEFGKLIGDILTGQVQDLAPAPTVENSSNTQGDACDGIRRQQAPLGNVRLG
jgi:hypothetical protein